MDVRLTWTDCDEAEDYVVPNVLSPRELVSGPDNIDETVLHTGSNDFIVFATGNWQIRGAVNNFVN